MSNWEYVVWDIEANGFQPSTIFCICITDLLTQEQRMFTGDEIADACVLLQEAKMIVGHYIRGYDCPVIERLTGGMIKFKPETIVDTLDMSKKLTSHKKHGLEFWGERFGLPKMPSPLFERYTPELLPYCRRDVDINVKLFFHLLEIYLEAPVAEFRNHERLALFVEAFAAHIANG
jgi:DNA polymerase III alpha subunit (gram-positive type)